MRVMQTVFFHSRNETKALVAVPTVSTLNTTQKKLHPVDVVTAKRCILT